MLLHRDLPQRLRATRRTEDAKFYRGISVSLPRLHKLALMQAALQEVRSTSRRHAAQQTLKLLKRIRTARSLAS